VIPDPIPPHNDPWWRRATSEQVIQASLTVVADANRKAGRLETAARLQSLVDRIDRKSRAGIS
jgi:hypothetical protein